MAKKVKQNVGESRTQFEDSPSGWQKRWTKEMTASKKMLDKFIEQGEKVMDRYLDKRDDTLSIDATRLNLFHSGINTVRSMLYGQVPKVDFDRRYADPDDDVARVGTLILERMLNADIERPNDDFTAVLRSCLDDRLLPGMGTARVRYEADIENRTVAAIYDEDDETELAPEYTESVLKFEQACVDYVYWKDFRWSYARTWHEVRWLAYRSYLDYDQLVKRFGEEKAKKITLTDQFDKNEKDAWQKGEVWEIWNKENKKVYWWASGMDEILDDKEDTLGLKDFFPGPRPMLANATTDLLVPRADFVITQDLYNEIDQLHTRISILTKACRVIGVYDKNSAELQRMLKEGRENDMIPVENWAMFGEKNGLKGVVDWFPLEAVVNTLDKLRELRSEQIALLYQVTGLSDIMRGQSEGSDRVSATEQSIKAKFASVRMQALQDEFARFGTDLMRIKAEVIAKHCSDETILKASNLQFTPDAQYAQPALELLRSQEDFVWRVAVRPESMAMVDYQALQAERGEFLNAIATFMQSAAPMLERLPNSLPTLLEFLKWGLAGFKGSQQIEGVMDRAVKEATEAAKNPPQPKPDPAMVKAQAEIGVMQEELKADSARLQAEMAAKQQEMTAEVQKAQQELMVDAATARQEMEQDRVKFNQELEQGRIKFAQEMEQAREAAKVKNEQIRKQPKSTP